jgi:hypothetical protein
MTESFYMLMFRVHEEGGMSGWYAVAVEGHGRKFTREQAEALAAQTNHDARFLFPYCHESARFADAESPPTLAFMPGETIWDYGEPTQVDLVAILREAVDGAECPDSNSVLLPIHAVVAKAFEMFGESDPHEVEAFFDRIVLNLGGRRTGDPPAYCMSIMRVLGHS